MADRQERKSTPPSLDKPAAGRGAASGAPRLGCRHRAAKPPAFQERSTFRRRLVSHKMRRPKFSADTRKGTCCRSHVPAAGSMRGQRLIWLLRDGASKYKVRRQAERGEVIESSSGGGVSVDLVWNAAKSSHRPWRPSQSPVLTIALPVKGVRCNAQSGCQSAGSRSPVNLE